MIRIYSVLFPWRTNVNGYSPTSTYYVYSDRTATDVTAVNRRITTNDRNETVRAITTIERSIQGLKHNRTYAIMVLPALNTTRSATMAQSIYRYHNGPLLIDDNRGVISDCFIDLRMIRLCKYDRSKGCAP